MELKGDGFASSPSSSPPHKRKAGRKKFRETRHPVYRGVRQRNGNKWVCEVREPRNRSRIWLGTFPTPEMAARAHDVAAIAFKDGFASLNFPDSSSSLPRPKSASVEDIQAAALEAAKAFGHVASASPSSSATSPFHDVAGCGKVLETDAQLSSGSTPMFVDEEEMFNMPALINSMAEGLLLAPPALSVGFSWDANDMDSHMDLSLWNDD